MEARQASEFARLNKDIEYQVEQARINALDDGYEKTMRQRELNNKKELDDIERQKQDYIQKVIQTQKEIFDAQTGSAQPHIYPQHIAEMPICELKCDKVKEYNTLVEPLFKMIGNNIAENEQLLSDFLRSANKVQHFKYNDNLKFYE